MTWSRIIGSILFAIGALLLYFSPKVFEKNRVEMESWIPHEAVVDRADMRQKVDDDNRKYHRVDVKYDYEWNGKTYKGTRYSLPHKWDYGRSGYKNQKAIYRSLLRAKNADEMIQIYINPDDPSKAVIKNTPRTDGAEAMLAGGAILILAGLYWLFRGVLRRPSRF